MIETSVKCGVLPARDSQNWGPFAILWVGANIIPATGFFRQSFDIAGGRPDKSRSRVQDAGLYGAARMSGFVVGVLVRNDRRIPDVVLCNVCT